MKTMKSKLWKPSPVQSAARIFLLSSLGLLGTAAQAQLTFSSSPPVAQDSPSPPPNVILTVDDSGSMGRAGIIALQNALRTAFSTANMPDGQIRLAYQAMWNNSGFGPNKLYVSGRKRSAADSPNRGNFNNLLRSFEGTHRTEFMRWVDTLDYSGWTPSHVMQFYAGEYMKGRWAGGRPQAPVNASTLASTPMTNVPANENPWLHNPGQANSKQPLTCRRAYHIFMTDGAWNSFNGAAPNISLALVGEAGNADGTARTLPDGVAYNPNAPESRVYADTNGNNLNSTFADLAFHYWATDLQPTIANEVDRSKTMRVGADEVFTSAGRPPATLTPYWNPKNNPATWQHMQTFTIGFNAAASLPGWTPAGFDGMHGPLFASYITGARNWLDPITSEAGSRREFDMYHAAINSRAKFYPATTAQALTNAFVDILSEISSIAALPGIASASASGSRLNAGTMAYVASYNLNPNTSKWEGAVEARRGDSLTATPVWSASIPAASARKIYTANKTGNGINFQWTPLTTGLTAAEIAALNLETTGTTTPSGSLMPSIYGLHLHDIVNSQIAHVGAPTGQFFGNPDYRAFFNSVRSRGHMVYVGANDGMLHGFDAGQSKTSAPGTGQEKLAYIPRGLISSLKKLTDNPYTHRYWVDGSPMVGEAQTGSSRPGGWSTVLVGTLGAGGKGYYILDVTRGDALSSPGELVIKDVTDSTDADLGHQFNAPVGSSYAGTPAQPQIVQLNKRTSGRGEWAVIMGNGYNSVNGRPVLLVQSLEGARTLYKVDACAAVTAAVCGAEPVSAGTGQTNGLSAPRTVDINGDGTVDVVYAGDLKGNLWKFDLTSTNAADWKVAFDGQPMFVAQGPSGDRQSIVSAPLAVVHPKGGYMLAVGTGRNLVVADETDTKLNSFYGLYDTQALSIETSGSPAAEVVKLGPGSPIPSTLSSGANRFSALYRQSAGELDPADASGLRKGQSTRDTSAVVDGVTVRGWYFDLPDIQNGNASKVLLNPVALSGNVVRFFSHNVSSTTSASSGNPEDQYCKTVTVDGMKTQINFFDLFNGNRPNATLMVGTSGSLTAYGADQQNRFQVDGVTHYLSDGSDDLEGVGADAQAKLIPPDVPGKRAGWRVAR